MQPQAPVVEPKMKAKILKYRWAGSCHDSAFLHDSHAGLRSPTCAMTPKLTCIALDILLSVWYILLSTITEVRKNPGELLLSRAGIVRAWGRASVQTLVLASTSDGNGILLRDEEWIESRETRLAPIFTTHGGTIMTRRKTSLVFAAILVTVLGITVSAPAQPVVPKFGSVGLVTTPHGFPQSYSDSANPVNTVVLCIDELDPFCITTPPETNGSFNPGFGDEGFYWMAEADADPPLVGGGRALLVLAVEAAYGGAGAVNNGDQMVFGRIRIRVDVPSAGDYRVIHPYGTKIFRSVTVADGINYTEDIGAFDNLLVADPIPTAPPLASSTIAIRAANNFMGTQASPLLQSLLKWDPDVLPAAPPRLHG